MQQQTGQLLTRDGLKLFTQAWLPVKTRAVLIISHGYAEHSGRYAHVAEHLVARGIAVCALDHRGHGRSEGERANVKVFREYITDLCRFVDSLRVEYPAVPRYLLGHSMGGAIALQFTLEYPEKLLGLVLSGAYLRNAVNVPAPLLAISSLLSRFLPGLPVQALDTKALSRDENVVAAYENDPLVYQGKAKARLGTELLAAGPYLLARMESVHLPVLIMHGGADRIASAEGSRELYEGIGSSDKTLKIYEGFYHEIFNEIGKEQVLEDLSNWLEQRLD